MNSRNPFQPYAMMDKVHSYLLQPALPTVRFFTTLSGQTGRVEPNKSPEKSPDSVKAFASLTLSGPASLDVDNPTLPAYTDLLIFMF